MEKIIKNNTFICEANTALWLSENENIEIGDLDFDSFTTELGYADITLQTANNPQKIILANVEVGYLIYQLDFLLKKFQLEKENNKITEKKAHIKSIHQHFVLELWYKNDMLYIQHERMGESENITLSFDWAIFVTDFATFKHDFLALLTENYSNFKIFIENF